MTITKKSICMSRKYGNRANKKNTTCSRLLYSPSSKRSYVRNNTKSGVKSYSTINKNATTNDGCNRTNQYKSFGNNRSTGAARMKKTRDAKKLKDFILDKNKTVEQQALILRTVLTDP